METATVKKQTLELIGLCDKTSTFLTKASKWMDAGMDDSDREGLSAVEKEEIATLTGARMADVIRFKTIQEKEKLAIADGYDE
jgi:hypothetical protein